MTLTDIVRPENSHIWKREAGEHYVEPEWCSRRLFDVEDFAPGIWDPACGFGRITAAAHARGWYGIGTDIVERGADLAGLYDFLKLERGRSPHIVTNPPFDLCREFAEHALKLAAEKVAMIFLVRRLPAARWLKQTPLRRIWLLTPRPSMPPGHVITAGQKPGGGKHDFCWLVWEQGYIGTPEMCWLYRDETA